MNALLTNSITWPWTIITSGTSRVWGNTINLFLSAFKTNFIVYKWDWTRVNIDCKNSWACTSELITIKLPCDWAQLVVEVCPPMSPAPPAAGVHYAPLPTQGFKTKLMRKDLSVIKSAVLCQRSSRYLTWWFVLRLSTCLLNTFVQKSLQINFITSSSSLKLGVSLVNLHRVSNNTVRECAIRHLLLHMTECGCLSTSQWVLVPPWSPCFPAQTHRLLGPEENAHKLFIWQKVADLHVLFHYDHKYA